MRRRHAQRGKEYDDFDWSSYNRIYRGELSSIAEVHVEIIGKGDYAFRDGKLLKLRDDIKPLHPNWLLLYETVLQLGVDSFCEFGCGGCDHIANILTLRPDLTAAGLDISEKQLAFARERHPGLGWALFAHDITEPLPAALRRVELSYTQAVLMHLQTGNNHLAALANMFRAAGRHVVLMENWTRHDFLADIRELHAARKIPWDDLHFHYRDSVELKRPHLMVVSTERLPQYPELTDFGILRDAVP